MMTRRFKEGEAPSIENAYAEIDFTGVPPGKYALVCYHDENSNGKFDENMLGMPKEGYCFSNNVKPRFRRPTSTGAHSTTRAAISRSR